MFANPTANDFSLKTGSPCIGAGEGGADMGAIPYNPTKTEAASLGDIRGLYR